MQNTGLPDLAAPFWILFLSFIKPLHDMIVAAAMQRVIGSQ